MSKSIWRGRGSWGLKDIKKGRKSLNIKNLRKELTIKRSHKGFYLEVIYILR